MGYGDEILAAGQAQRHFDATGKVSVIVDVEGRVRQHDIWDSNPAIEQHPQPGWSFDGYHVIKNGPHCRPYIVYPFTEDSGWTFNEHFHARDHRARLYLTPNDLYRGAETRRRHGPYILVDPWSKHANLRWPIEWWSQLVEALRAHGHVVVQHIYRGAPLLPFVIPIESPSFRVACGLVACSSLYVRGESGMCHAAAALGRAQVTIWGACMSWDALGGYDKQIGLGVSARPCGSYRACQHCKTAMANILPEAVFHAIETQLECYAQEA